MEGIVIIIDKPLNQIDPERLPDIFKKYADTLDANDGIRFHIIDIRKLGHMICYENMQYQDIHELIYTNKAILDLELIENLMPNLGFKIKTIDIDKNSPYIRFLATKEVS